MSEATYNQPLAQAAAEAMSTLGFMFPVGEPEPGLRVDAADAVVATVAFSGPVDGALDLRVSAAVLPALAANMSGTDEPPPPEQQKDALGEMLNIICGNVLPHLTDPRAVYDVAAPRCCDAPPDHRGRRVVGHTGIPMDAGLVELTLYVAEAAALARD